jgi:hypothetical protein
VLALLTSGSKSGCGTKIGRGGLIMIITKMIA